MPRYAIFFSYTPQAWKAMLDNPSDRAAAARQISEAVGGSVETFYWMFGEFDGFAIGDLPDDVSAAALSVAISSSGAFGRVQTHRLLDEDERAGLVEKAQQALAAYSPPTG